MPIPPRNPTGPLGPLNPKRYSSRVVVTGVLVTAAILAFAVFQLVRAVNTPHVVPIPEVTLTGAEEAIDAGKVVHLHLNDGSRRATLLLTNGDQAFTVYPQGSGPDLTKRAIDAHVKVTAAPNKSRGSIWPGLLISLLPVLLLIGFFVVFMGPKMGMNIGRLGKGRNRPADVPDTRFADVAGVDEAVAELAEVVEFLHSPDRFNTAGATVPHGFLLVGPAGTGKTLLARALAGEAGVPFFSLAGSDFVETFVGVGASRVRQVFAAARKKDRAIVFIDEIDAVGKVRSAGPNGSGSEERENTLNQLLVEMDGFSRSGVVVLGATNRPDVLDAALTRPGRFDRQIVIPAPDRAGRTKVLELHARDRRFADDVDFVSLARRTPGLTGADLAFLVNEAAMEAARSGSDTITAAHLDSALSTAVVGRARLSAVVTARDRSITAWHEAGHAVAALVLPHAEDPVSITIVPRGQAGGVTWMGGNDNNFLTRSEAEARLVVGMAGRAAEEVHLEGDFTQGAASDFAAATNLALAMVTEYGMSDLGVACRSGPHQPAAVLADEVGSAVDRLLERALTTARQVVAANSVLLEALVAELLAEDTVSGVSLTALASRLAIPVAAVASDDAGPTLLAG